MPRKTNPEKSLEQKQFPKADVQRTDSQALTINGQAFTVKEWSQEEAIDLDALADRYMPILDSYDYIVGDWAYEQLRLKGFYKDDVPHVPLERKISHLTDYLLEYCNFACEYFVLEHSRDDEERQERNAKLKKRPKKNKNRKAQKKKSRRRENNKTSRKKRPRDNKTNFSIKTDKSSAKPAKRQTITQGNKKREGFKIRSTKGKK
ncbi:MULTISPECIES: YutD family protein [Aerococcus]|uniref:DUF1027 domain-containing protein n=1 Tax=Aerococcus sanguinicola TaxID=119206 RepID=A0A5N1GL46_9LACT|nr:MULTISPECIES: YutD family protein [Aerococcus]KAA9300939.1 DUF1027 domain-containing protein [Aerococcus sanguinicola]MDK6369172.1 YutD family protein [Aerococcus sp. UMB9870]MDK6679768.1 YutD family protein [Aerococcus sp. UMB8608]MDK6686665.1 YutD family protein [Aerococcus sp. UMB8623]MDK6939690.1 YutD family protein [Aerococcus sp. UMB8487]